MEKSLIEKIEEQFNFYEYTANQSSDLVDFCDRYAQQSVYSKIDDVVKKEEVKSILNSFFQKVSDFGTKVCIEYEKGSFTFVGGGSMLDYDDRLAKIVNSGGYFGVYIGFFNIIHIPAYKEIAKDIINSKSSFYGIDKNYITENPLDALFSTFLHELIHAYLHSQRISEDAKFNPDVISFDNTIRQIYKVTKLKFLAPIVDDNYNGNVQEIITHLTTNSKYYNFIQKRDYRFQVSQVILAHCDSEESINILVDVLNSWCRLFFSSENDVVYKLTDYTVTNNFLSDNFYTTYITNVIGGLHEFVTDKYGFIINKVRPFSYSQGVESEISKVIGVPNVDFDLYDNLEKVDSYLNGTELNNVNKRVLQSKDKVTASGVDASEYYSFRESVKKYNIDNGNLTWLELECYLYCNPKENKNIWVEEIQYTENDYLNSESEITVNDGFDNQSTVVMPTIVFDGYVNHFFSYFVHGDLYQKIIDLKNNQNLIEERRGTEYYEKLISSLEGIKNVNISFDNPTFETRPFVNPISEFALNFYIETWKGNERSNNKSYRLTEAFKDSLKSWYRSAQYDGIKSEDIIKALKGERFVQLTHKGQNLTTAQRIRNSEDDMNNYEQFDEAWNMCCVAFSDFIANILLDEDRERIEKEILSINNRYNFTDYSKIPVGFSHSRKFKRKNLTLSKVQRNTIGFLNVNKTGLLAYGVGVGKTLSALISIANKFDLGEANKALFIVPNPTYTKWISDAHNEEVTIIDKETGVSKNVVMQGALPQVNIVGLGNLNDQVMLNLKDYTDDELDTIEKAKQEKEQFEKDIFELLGKFAQDEDEDEDEDGDDSDDSEDEKKKTNDDTEDDVKVKFKIDKTANIDSLITDLDKILQRVDINAFSTFNISLDENKNIENIIRYFNNEIQLNGLDAFPNSLFNIYEKFKVDIKKLAKKNNAFSFNTIPQYINVSVIINIIYESVKNLPQFYIASLGNLKNFPDNTIFFATYEALSNMSFKKKTLLDKDSGIFYILMEVMAGYDGTTDIETQEKYLKKISKILSDSSLKGKLYFEDFGFDYLCVDEAHNMKNLLTTVTATSKDDDRKKLYEGNQKQIASIKGAPEPSKRALIGFLMSLYIQTRTNGSNICMLTATPFTNSPLEIYSMILLTNYQFLRNNGYPSVKSFVDEYVKFKTDVSVSVGGNIQINTEPIGYNNLNRLKRLIFTHLDFRTAEESEIVRPCKVTIPTMEQSLFCYTEKENEETAKRELAKGVYGFEIEKPISSIVVPTYEQRILFSALQNYLISQVDVAGIDIKFKEFILKRDADYINQNLYIGIEDVETYQNHVNTLTNAMKNFFNKLRDGSIAERVNPATATLKCLASFKNISISPYMFRPFVETYLGISTDRKSIMANVKPSDVINSSTKLSYVVNCIKQVNNYTDSLGIARKGFYIYSNLGTKEGANSPISMVKYLKEYLLDPENGFGYNKSAYSYIDPTETANKVIGSETGKRKKRQTRYSDVELLIGNVSKEKRKEVMSLYNEGKIKIVITTVKEGIDLQVNTIGMFNISVDWNPTDATQIEGRGFRQGNKNAYFIANYPLVADSSDVAIYQKLKDKTSRLSKLTDRSVTENQFNLGEINIGALQREMITSVEKLAPYLFIMENKENVKKINKLKNRLEDDVKIINDYKQFNEIIEPIRVALTLYTRLPILIEAKNTKSKLEEKIKDIAKDIVFAQDRLNDAIINLPSKLEIQKLESENSDIEIKVKELKSQFSELMFDDKQDEAKEVKKQADALNESIKKNLESIEKLKVKLETEETDEIKEIKREIKNLVKDGEASEEKLSKIDEKTKQQLTNVIVPLDFQKEDFTRGNYFVLSGSNNYVYSDKQLSLFNIDYLNSATYFDIFVALKKVTEAYNKDTSELTAPYFDYYNEFGSFINIYDILKDSNLNIFDESQLDLILEFTNGQSIYYYNLLNNVRNLESTRDKKTDAFLLMNQNIKSETYKRALQNYRSIVEDNDPDEYLANLREQISKLVQESGETSISYLSDESYAKYIEKARLEVLKKRELYSDFVTLTDDYMTLKPLMNVTLEKPVEVIETKESAENVTIEPADTGVNLPIKRNIKELIDILSTYKQGGKINVMHNAKKGGYAYGKKHSECELIIKNGISVKQCGIKGVIDGSQTEIEFEGGELITTAPVSTSQKKYEFEGKKMTPIEIISKINKEHGGIEIV